MSINCPIQMSMMCERSLIVAALNALETSDTTEAKRRLLQLFSDKSQFIDAPEGRI